ncbi:S41 family peptidase [Chloroflexota bacterium]
MSKKMKYIIISLLSVTILALAFGIGYDLGGQSALDEDVVSLEQAWYFIFSDYVDKTKLNSGNMSRAAIEGMIEQLDDPYTSYLSNDVYQLGLGGLEGEIEGIGAQVGIREEKLTIIAPIAGSPADKAGIRAGDVVLEVDGKPTAEMSLAEAVLTIRGTKGTAVRLLVLHEGESESVEIEIVRDTIEIASVRFEMRENIAYIHITNFSRQTDEELSPALAGLAGKGAEGIILDLRSNPGGLLDEVIDIASHFLTDGVVVSVVDNKGEKTFHEVKTSEVVTDLPVVILVNGFSASGSEVLSGALQDYGRATVAGSKTYGKGSVNILRELENGSAIYITTARWLTPDGRPIEGEGLEPDIELELEGEEAVQWAIDYLAGLR